MNLLKNIFIGIFFLYAMYWGGVGTQSEGTFAQGLGFVSVVMALGSLYVLYKLIPKVLSSTTTVLIIVLICAYSAYCLGLFNGKSMSEFLTGQPVENQGEDNEEEEAQDIEDTEDDIDNLAGEMFGGESGAQKTSENGSKLRKMKAQNRGLVHRRTRKNSHPQSRTTQPAKSSGGLIGKLKTALFGEEKPAQQAIVADINPYDYPSITGYARAITGSIIQIDDLTVKLFGIAAPDLRQTCADKHGAGYFCGRASATWLQNWLNNREVTCYVLGQVVRGRATGVCFVENNKIDVAAAVINAGWAVAYTRNTQVYVPYEQQAALDRKGLWQGEFYKPWDWEKIQNRKVDIQIHVPEPKSSSSSKGWGVDWNTFKGLF